MNAGIPEGNALGRAMHDLAAELFPLCRSITGDGVRQTLRILQKRIPLDIREVPTGTPVLDWTVPKEWNIRDAYIKDVRGERIVDFRTSNLHVVGYSVPVRGTLTLAELRPHLHTLPDRPDWIPYRTSYWKETWGFCLPHKQLQAMTEGPYEVCIDATLEDGFLTYGELFLPGETEGEVLLSCHVCHPSLGNDNLSGIALATFLARALAARPRRYGYRFLFIPGTIGSIAWLARNEAVVPRIRHGLVVASVGDRGALTYKKSRRGNAEIDRAAVHVLRHSGADHAVLEFTPYGYDERQYCSPGFDLPVGCLMRTPHGRYPEYHTSGDDLAFIDADHLAASLETYLAVCDVLEGNRTYLNQNPKGEPQLGRRGLYGQLGGRNDAVVDQMALLWVLNLADGQHSLLDMAERSGMPFPLLRQAAAVLLRCRLLREA